MTGLPLVRCPAGAEALGLLRVAAAVETISPRSRKAFGHRDRLVEQAARMLRSRSLALDLVAASWLLMFRDRLLQAVGGLLVELGDADIADVVAVGCGCAPSAPLWCHG